MLRGSLEYGAPVSGSCTKKVRFRVLCVRNGSSIAVDGSGSSCMSDSWICWKPRIDEPSNMRPSVKMPSPNDDAGTVKCCIVPGRSQNLTSTKSTFSSAMKRRTSSALLNINPPGTGHALLVSRHAIRTLDVGNFRTVSAVFRRCYGPAADVRDLYYSPCYAS